ncbi:cutinase family protein [Nocardia sp. NPDC048505]|uniref:cutinase family protein n=1 Tax=Nocardia sp. NPDC048505 TaxID=3155756 RepID=UPI0033F9E5D1
MTSITRLGAITTATGLAIALFTAAPALAEDTGKKGDCPDIHVLAVQGTGQSSVDQPTEQDEGELSAVILPVLNGATEAGYSVERTYVNYPASFGNQGLSSAYKSSVLDGYNRLTQVAARVVYQCPATKLVALGYSQGGHAVSMWAQAVAAGRAGEVTPEHVALVSTFGDPTRAADAALFVGRPGQIGPAPWPGTDQKTRPSAAKFGDLYTSPTGMGIGPERDIAASFGKLDGRVAQWCIGGDLACSAPKSASLARTALSIAGQSSLDFTKDPWGVAATLAAATANTVGTGMATFADKDIKGSSLANVYFDKNASISARLEEAADPRNAAAQTNPLVGVLKMGQVVLSSVMSFVGTVFNSSTLGSLVNAGVQVATGAATGSLVPGVGTAAGAAAAAPALIAPLASLAGNTAKAAINIIPPQSAEKKVSSIFDLLINEVKQNADLPALLMDSRMWNQASTHGGYRSARVSSDGATPMEITADWVIAAGRDYAAARIAAEQKKTRKDTVAPKPTDSYDRTKDGKVTNPGVADLTTVAKTDTPGDVRLSSAPNAAAATTSSKTLTWLPESGTSIAARYAAAVSGTGPAANLLRSGSPLLLATTAREKK